MSDIIRLLPDAVANQIAAGEVIQRPASVIKELVENAVDAGATEIKIFITDAGRTRIQVIDNGSGMSAVDARMAFERHATSKIRNAGDLFSLHTMGFRGEALPSICAISQLELKTRTSDSQMGTLLEINGSKVERQEACVCSQGCSFTVKNLFFNVPARRKFLKSDSVELGNIMREFERLALVNNTVKMSIDTGHRSLELRPGTFHQRINDLWKNNLKMQLLPVEVDTPLVKIHGYISRPEFARRRNALQFLIVNGRNMRHPYFHRAILSCFDNLIASDTQPCYFLKFEVDPATIDVNIHPTKNEIKFEYESEIWPLLVAAVKASLGKNSAVPSIDFDSQAVEVVPVREGELPQKPEIELPADYDPFEQSRRQWEGAATGGGTSASHWESLYEDFMRSPSRQPSSGRIFSGNDFSGMPESANTSLPGIIPEMENVPIGKSIYIQLDKKYIVTLSSGKLLVVDQFRAHFKVLYEKWRQTLREPRGISQRALFPEPFELDSEQTAILSGMEPLLRKVGFQFDNVEGNQWIVTGLPAELASGEDPREMFLRVLESVQESGSNYGAEANPSDDLTSAIAISMARKGAITGGVVLTEMEMETLVADLFALPDPQYTPLGGKTHIYIDAPFLASLF